MTTSNSLNIIGIGGLPRSGKDSLAELFMERGYYGVSLGDIIRDESRKRHVADPDPISVKNMTETANYLRAQHGPDFALKEALHRFEEARANGDYKGLVVFSIRMPVEVDFILQHGGRLVWVEATDEVRHKRSLQHKREGEVDTTLEEMKAQEALQEKPQPDKPAKIQMNTTYVREQATETFDNNGGDIEQFKKDAQKALGLA